VVDDKVNKNNSDRNGITLKLPQAKPCNSQHSGINGQALPGQGYGLAQSQNQTKS